MSKKTHNHAMWGLELGGSALRLVRLRHSGSQYHADKFAEYVLENRWDNPADLAQAVRRTDLGKVSGPLAICGADQMILFRTLLLPQAEPGTLEKMIHGQLETLIPSRSERFATGYQARTDPYQKDRLRVLLCAVRRDVLSNVLEACKTLGADIQGLIPSIVALGSMWARLADPDQEPTLLLDIGARCTGLALLDGNQLVECAVIDQAADHFTERIAERLGITPDQADKRKLDYLAQASAQDADPQVRDCLEAALADWSSQLRETYQQCCQTLPRQRRPRRCLVFGRSAGILGVSELIARTLDIEVTETPAPDGLSLAKGLDFHRSACAVGAAMSAMDSDWQTVNLTGAAKEKSSGRKISWWRWVALGVWLLAAALGLYGLDKVEADRLTQSVLDIRKETNRQDGLTRQLDIGRHLESGGPTPLAALDRITEVLPEKALLTGYRYAHEGSVTIGGTVANEKDFLGMYEKLSEIGAVEVKSARPDKDKFRFEAQVMLARTLKPTAPEIPEKPDSEPPAKPPEEKSAEDKAPESDKTPEASPDKTPVDQTVKGDKP